jgi:hypothetical protein
VGWLDTVDTAGAETIEAAPERRFRNNRRTEIRYATASFSAFSDLCNWWLFAHVIRTSANHHWRGSRSHGGDTDVVLTAGAEGYPKAGIRSQCGWTSSCVKAPSQRGIGSCVHLCLNEYALPGWLNTTETVTSCSAHCLTHASVVAAVHKQRAGVELYRQTAEAGADDSYCSRGGKLSLNQACAFRSVQC